MTNDNYLPMNAESDNQLKGELVYENIENKNKVLDYSLGIIEELVDVSNKTIKLIEKNEEKIPIEVYSLLKKYITELDGLISIIDTNSIPIEIVNVPTEQSALPSSIITKLGIAGEVIRLRKNGETIVNISRQLKVSEGALKRFFKYYDKLKPSEKSKYIKSSVFDTTSRLEELKNIIVRRIYSLEGVNDEVARQYTTELRQTYQLALQVTEKIASYEQYKNFTKSVYELIKDELPHKRADILRKIQAIEKGHLFEV